VLGKVLFTHDVFVYAVPFLALAIWFSSVPNSLRPVAAGRGRAAGCCRCVRVSGIPDRYVAVIAGGGLAGLAGAYFSVVYTQGLAEGMTNGRGWIADRARDIRDLGSYLGLAGALLFGFVDGLNFEFQGIGVPVSTHLLAMMPYVFTLVVLVATWTRMRHRHVGMPEALGLAYERKHVDSKEEIDGTDQARSGATPHLVRGG